MVRRPAVGRRRSGRAPLLDPPERRRGADQLTAPHPRRTRGRPPKAALHIEHHRSAGGLIVHGSKILLISVMGGRRWQLPKGHIEAGETAEEAAVREVREETGVTGRIAAPLPSVEYWFVHRGRQRVHKTVDYFLLEYVSGDVSGFDPKEVSGAEWVSWDEGLSRLTYENERKAVLAAREMVEGRIG